MRRSGPLPSCTLRVVAMSTAGCTVRTFCTSSRRRLTAPRGAVSDAAASTRAGRAASGRSPRGARLLLWVAASGRTALVRGLC